MMDKSEVQDILSGLFMLISIISLFIAAWIWMWDMKIAIALGRTGALAFGFSLISGLNAIIAKREGR